MPLGGDPLGTNSGANVVWRMSIWETLRKICITAKMIDSKSNKIFKNFQTYIIQNSNLRHQPFILQCPKHIGHSIFEKNIFLLPFQELLVNILVWIVEKRLNRIEHFELAT